MLTIHGIPVSVHTRKVIVAAHEKRIEFRVEPVIPFQPPAGWEELSPTGKIPVVTDGALLLRDSSAICAYLERVHPEPSLYPLDPAEYARALYLEEYADTTVFPEVVRPLFHQQVIRPRVLGQPTEPAAIEHVMQQVMLKVFGYLDRVTDGEFLAGNAFSVADIALMSNLLNYRYLGLRVEPRYPRLRRYFERHVSRASFRKALEAEQQAASSLELDRFAAAA